MNKSRLLWACRRGMLELDTLFTPFVNDVYEQLGSTDKKTFQRLLTSQDAQLFAWFMGSQSCSDPDLAKMINAIRAHIKA